MSKFPTTAFLELVDEIAHHDFTQVVIEWPDFRVVIARRDLAENDIALAPESTANETVLAATIAGTFTFGNSPAVAIGNRMEVGQALGAICVLETRTPVLCSEAGTLTAALAREGEFVEYGQTLFRLTRT